MISFGPVPSRRLGRSLGINNIVTPKTCSYDCLYCQVGKTTHFSTRMQNFFEPEIIFREVTNHLRMLDKNNIPDYLTFVSNGEPTLDKNLGATIKLLKKLGIPIAVITNASLLFMDTVREDLQFADWVSVKIDAPDSDVWLKINRPAEGLDFGRHIESLRCFSKYYSGVLCTETMLVEKVNTSITQIECLAGLAKSINPAKSYLSIPIRPPAVVKVKAPDEEKVNMAWQIFTGKQIEAELLTGFEGIISGYTGNAFEDILNITAVHPLREDSVAELLLHDKADFSVVSFLERQQLIKAVIYNNERFYIRKYFT